MSVRPVSGVDLWLAFSVYLLGTDGDVFLMSCSTDDVRPDDDWLSIANTLEFLPAEK